MSSLHLYRRSDMSQAVTAAVSVATTGDKANLVAVVPINIVRWGFIATVALTGAPVFALDKRITVGSDTGRVNAATSGGDDTAGGTLTPGTLAAGAGAFREVNQVPGPFKLNPGEEAIFEVTTAAGAGSGYFFAEYEEEGFAGDATLPAAEENRLVHMTKKVS